MAQYTQSIREILQQNKTASEDLRKLSDVYAIANRTLFAYATQEEMPFEPLLSYREPFVTGFALHFFNDELALETLPLWQISLHEKLLNNHEYITQIFDNLDKQVFADYKVRTDEGHSNVIASLSEENDGSDSRTTSNTKGSTGSVTNTESASNEKGGSIDRTKSGEDTLTKGGTIGDVRAISEQGTQTGTDEVAKTGTEAVAHAGTVETAHDGADTVTNDLLTTNEDLGGQVTDKQNAIGINYDTPQGSLANMRTPGGDATGTGVAYANGQTYNYMSNAQETNNTNVHESHAESQSADTGTVETAYDSTTTQTMNNTDTTTHNTTSTETRNLADSKTVSDSNTKTMNTEDVQAYDSSEVETHNLIESTSKENMETRALQDTEDGTSAGTVHGVKSASNETEKVDSGNATEYTMNWEMLYRSMPLLNKVWEIFDDLFMILL